jgi:hypothetical protein
MRICVVYNENAQDYRFVHCQGMFLYSRHQLSSNIMYADEMDHATLSQTSTISDTESFVLRLGNLSPLKISLWGIQCSRSGIKLSTSQMRRP